MSRHKQTDTRPDSAATTCHGYSSVAGLGGPVVLVLAVVRRGGPDPAGFAAQPPGQPVVDEQRVLHVAQPRISREVSSVSQRASTERAEEHCQQSEHNECSEHWLSGQQLTASTDRMCAASRLHAQPQVIREASRASAANAVGSASTHMHLAGWHTAPQAPQGTTQFEVIA